ncbi:radical SAM protein [Photobacterium atrarenae]|uniref:Radical SAM protein n=1 Tax=Photobacterium atrarenae TaxID=865757 RepID=A0ABY5GDI8_9GAMM|nr:radical SAM protein [Photobacterium atrarenae]UTV26936.1 radical SAM protein [Photobacterium atrarenae]
MSNTNILQNKLPVWVTLQLTDACNLRCKMCYEWGENGAYHGRKISRLDKDAVLRVIDECLPVKPYFALFGGEPMMYPWFEDVVGRIRQGGARVDVPTNGTFLKRKAEMLVETPPNRLWVSLDGPEEINDAQRGENVYRNVQEGVATLFELRERKGLKEPKIGYTFIVTPLTHLYIQGFFENCLDLDMVDHISIEFQTYATAHEHDQHRQLFRRLFGVEETPCAAGMQDDPRKFEMMDFEAIQAQIHWVEQACKKRGIYFVCYPKTIASENYRAYFTKQYADMADQRDKCFFPWIYMEVASNGDITPCHTFYDVPLGNIYEQSVSEIWNGGHMKNFRHQLLRQGGLFPICGSCARYYADPNKR